MSSDISVSQDAGTRETRLSDSLESEIGFHPISMAILPARRLANSHAKHSKVGVLDGLAPAGTQ